MKPGDRRRDVEASCDNVALELAARARERPDDLAVAVARRRGGFDELTFSELEARARGWIGVIERLGVVPGDHVVLMVPPSVDFFALTFALLRSGAVLVLVDPGMGLRNLGRCLAEARPRAFFGVRKALLARRLFGWVPEVELVQRVSSAGPPAGGPPEGSECEATGQAPGAATAERDRPAAILFTSGSTGPAKGALYTHGMFCAQVAALRSQWGIQPGERDLATFPLFALFGPALGMAAVVPWMDASRPGRADPARLVEALDTYRCTNLFASPALVEKLGAYCVEQGRSLPTLRRALSAGAPASLPSLQRFAAALDDAAEVHTPYGATESLPVATIGSRELLDETRAETEKGAGVCVGRALEGVELRIVPIEDGEVAPSVLEQPLPAGEIGEIVVSSAQTSPSYFGRPEATRHHKLRDAAGRLWHRMGDVGWLDDQGRLWMCGRLTHRVRCEGGDLFTIPCEAIFNRHPDVRRTALVGVGPPDRARPVLCVEPRRRLGRGRRTALVGELLELGAGDPRTRRIETVLFRRSFPVDVRHNAKIFREQLALWAARRLGVDAGSGQGGG
ncbi:MAG: peptide synthase [Acidobacteria bacterium]|mgnify:CR=1 FL=1|nr:MAG: peptide synthase [Acidobacteriota bacterium]REK00144.1 MAG: peptide synthase [Acidobacteriota bacterium]